MPHGRQYLFIALTKSCLSLLARADFVRRPHVPSPVRLSASQLRLRRALPPQCQLN